MQYHFLEYSLGERQEWQDEWHRLAEEGWEFIHETNGFCIFKRPKQREDESSRPKEKDIMQQLGERDAKEQPKECLWGFKENGERYELCPKCDVVGRNTIPCPKHDA